MERKDMTNAQLVEQHNTLAARFEDVQPFNSWKKSKDLLIERIEALEARWEAEKPVEEAPVEDAEKPKTIRETAMDLLCEVSYYEDKTKKPSPDNVVEAGHPNARSVGIPYVDVIDRIKEQFPDAQTSVACLRWYAVKARVGEFGYEDYRLVQRRPRSRQK